METKGLVYKEAKIAQVSKSLTYYTQRIEELQLTINEKGQNLRRLQAQRNELNAKGELLLHFSLNLLCDYFF